MPCTGMAHCNRVQKTSFFPIHQSWRSATRGHRGSPLSLFTEKLTPGDAGPKTNALRPLLDRYETTLLCWKNWKRYQRQTVRLNCSLWKRLRVSPACTASVLILYMQQDVSLCSVFVKFSLLLHKLQVNSFEVRNRLSSLTGSWEYKSQLFFFFLKRGDWNGFFAWLQTHVNFPKRSQLCKSTEEKRPRWRRVTGKHRTCAVSPQYF